MEWLDRCKINCSYLGNSSFWQDMREATSPSFFNPAEAVVVLDYIKQLVNEGVKPRDIGVITPYR